MFLGDTGKGEKIKSKRYNFDVLVDNEKFTLQKLSSRLGFYSIEYQGRFKEIETVYDTPNNLLTGSGIVIRKRQNKDRCYFSLIRINSLKNSRTSDRKEFLGECEPKDQPKNFPVQIADKINEIFNSVFTVDLVDVINHCEPYVYYEITGNKYKIISGTGYEAEMSFENFNVRNMRTGKRAKLRNFSISFPMQPEFEKERNQILEAIDIYCNELVPLDRNNFEIAEVAVRTRVPKPVQKEENGDRGNKKNKKETKEE